MYVSVIPEDCTSYTFEDVEIGDMFLNDEGTWFMKVEYEEEDCDRQDVFGLNLEDGTLYVFNDKEPIMRFFTPSAITVQ